MKKLFMLIPILFVVFACEPIVSSDSMEVYYRRYCSTPEQQECFGDRNIACIDAANPKSDEEPEDWLPHCRKMAREACCPLTKGIKYMSSSGYEKYWIPWSEVPEEHKGGV